MARSKTEGEGVATALKEQLVLISFLVLFAGMVSTDTYYASFGLKYQFLDLTTEHLIYRGITALMTSWLLGIAYAITIFWLGAGWSLSLATFPSKEHWLNLATYLVIAGVALVAYSAAIDSGARAATKDLTESISSLPKIESAKDTSGKKLPLDGYRVLFSGRDTIAVFKAGDGAAQLPFIHLLKRDDVGEIILVRD